MLLHAKRDTNEAIFFVDPEKEPVPLYCFIHPLSSFLRLISCRELEQSSMIHQLTFRTSQSKKSQRR